MSDRSSKWQEVTRGIADFFFPRKCPFCGAAVGRDLLCEKCERDLPYCEAITELAGGIRVTAPLWYEGYVRDAILAFKFQGKLGGLQAFGSLMAQCAAERYSGEFDAVTWVPVSSKRLRKRGFDQSRYLAASACVDWHAAPQETLRKIADNPPQSGVADAAQRRANVKGVYEAVNPDAIAGVRFLLIDDIFTTGATLTECSRVLKEAGAAEVICLTLAATRKKENDSV